MTETRKRYELFIILILSINYVYFLPRWADWSQNSRLDLTFAIVDKNSLSIDDYYKNTGDYAFFQDHYYLDKAPGPSFLAVPIYYAVRPILRNPVVEQYLNKLAASPGFAGTLQAEGTGLLRDKIYFAIVLYIVTFFLSSIPTIIIGLLLFRFLAHLGISHSWSTAIVVIYGLATNAYTYASAFYSHQLTAACLFGSFFIGFQVQKGAGGKRPGLWLLLAGILLGFSLISEYPTILIAGAIVLYMLKKIKWSVWFPSLLLGGLIPGILLMAYNLAIFKTILPVGYEYSALYTEQHSQGLISLTFPHLDAFWGITFGSFRGLFYVSPITFVALIGLCLGWKTRKFVAEWLVCMWSVLAFILFNSSSVMWQGGFSVGPRYLVPMLPFLIIGLGYLVILFSANKNLKAIFVIFAVYSGIVVWTLTLSGQNYPDWTLNPLWNYSIPKLLSNDVARNLGMVLGLKGFSSIIPLWAISAGIAILLIFKIHPKQPQSLSKNEA
jgi:hypothetical protein